jgi:hypothetical protein
LPSTRREGQFRLSAEDDDEAIRTGELGLGETGVATARDHVADTRAHAFDVLGEVKRFSRPWVPWH